MCCTFYQLQFFKRAIVAGTSINRIKKASTKIAAAMPMPKALTIRTSADIKEKQIKMTIIAALVIIRPLLLMPVIILEFISPVFS